MICVNRQLDSCLRRWGWSTIVRGVSTEESLLHQRRQLRSQVRLPAPQVQKPHGVGREYEGEHIALEAIANIKIKGIKADLSFILASGRLETAGFKTSGDCHVVNRINNDTRT